ncbi:MAG: hypothetical protein IJL26_08000 [Clostridia bacterium]|nr:hypothetical protein [Clostridia bacterium]
MFKTKTKIKPNKTDVLAAVLFGFMFLFFTAFLRRGLNAALSDESYYFAMPYRFLQGDRMLVDEWYLTQFNSVLLMPVMKAFLAVRGSTDGILLFFRCLFLLFHAAIYWILYLQTRDGGLPALFAVFLFCMSVPFAVFSFSYYAVGLYLYAIVCAALFYRDKRPSAPTLFFAGVAYSFAVFSEPGALLGWVVLAFLTVLRTICSAVGRPVLERYGNTLNFRVLGLTAAGGAVCGGGMLVFLGLKSGFSDILRALPLLFADPEHIAPFSKLLKLLFPFMTFGAAPYFLCAVFLLGTAAYRLCRRKSRTVKGVLLIGACVSLCVTMGSMLVRSLQDRKSGLFDFFLVYPYLFNLFGLELYFLSDDRNPRRVPFLFAGFCIGIGADLFSEATFGFGGTLVLFYIADALPRLVGELRRTEPAGDNAARKGGRLLRGGCLAAVTLLLVSTALWQARYCSGFASPQYERKAAAFFGESSAVKTDVKLERGPLRGLYTSSSVSRKYNAALDDLDVINATCSGTLYIPELAPYMYLYSTLRCGTLSVFFEGDYVYDRQRDYWTLLPEKRPDAIYVPNDWFAKQQIPEEKLAFVKSVCSYEAQRLGAGILFRVKDWKI